MRRQFSLVAVFLLVLSRAESQEVKVWDLKAADDEMRRLEILVREGRYDEAADGLTVLENGILQSVEGRTESPLVPWVGFFMKSIFKAREMCILKDRHVYQLCDKADQRALLELSRSYCTKMKDVIARFPGDEKRYNDVAFTCGISAARAFESGEEGESLNDFSESLAAYEKLRGAGAMDDWTARNEFVTILRKTYVENHDKGLENFLNVARTIIEEHKNSLGACSGAKELVGFVPEFNMMPIQYFYYVFLETIFKDVEVDKPGLDALYYDLGGLALDLGMTQVAERWLNIYLERAPNGISAPTARQLLEGLDQSPEILDAMALSLIKRDGSNSSTPAPTSDTTLANKEPRSGNTEADDTKIVKNGGETSREERAGALGPFLPVVNVLFLIVSILVVVRVARKRSDV